MLPRKVIYIAINLCLLLLSAPTHSENLYDSVTGELILPVIFIDENTSYFGRFARVSEDPLIWAATTIEAVSMQSRTAAVYNPETASLWVPEINVQGVLYSLSFRITNNCEAVACLEPELASVREDGRAGGVVFTTPLSSASTFACASCHAMSETDGFASDGFRRPGHSLQDSSKRETFKNGLFTDMLDAVNTCVTEWMNATAWTSDDTDWINLLNWLDDQSDVETAAAVVIDVVAPPVDLTGGDADNGRALFNTRCIVCHGFDGVGTLLAPMITDVGLEADYIARRVRSSGRSDSETYVGLTGGVMPFWGADRLSDGELVDIIAFISAGETADLDVGGDDPIISTDTGCTNSSPKIGQTAILNGFFHGVAGTATIIDDCTIDLTGFSFDGGGIDVRVYVGIDGEFRTSAGGFSISNDLVGIAYSDNTLRLTLPAGRTLDSFNSISIWCVTVGVSFGTGFFNQDT